MSDKKKYYKLDETGRIGSQDPKSAEEKKRIYDKTAEIIKAEKEARAKEKARRA